MATLTASNNRQIPWPPAGGVEYTVQKKGRDGESFVDIARKKNIRNEKGEIDPWKLIAFNFQTHSPNEVNFILRTNFPTARRAYDGVNYMFSGNEKIYLPPTGAAVNPKPSVNIADLADALDLEVSDLYRFLSEYSWLNDLGGGLLGLITEFAGLDILGAANTVFGGISGVALFALWLKRLDQQDQIAMSLYAACYQAADWAVTPEYRLSRNVNVPTPEFPERWVKLNFFGVSSNAEFPPEQRERLDAMRQAWERGAAQMRNNLATSLRTGYNDLLRNMARHGKENPGQQLPFNRYEDLVKLSLFTQTKSLPFGRDARGLAVAIYFFVRFKPVVEQKSSFIVERKPEELLYPSTELNTEHLRGL